MSDIREQTAQRNQGIVNEWYDGSSYSALARKHGMSICSIQKMVKIDQLLADNVRERALKPRDPRVTDSKKPISSTHYKIGMRVGRYMAEHKLLATEMGARIHKSRVAVSNMQIGAFDLTLSDVMKLSGVLEIPYEELVLGSMEAPIVKR